MSNLDDFRSAKISTWPIVLLRVYTGIIFLYFGVRKVTGDFGGDGVAGFLGSRENMYGFYKPIAEFFANTMPGGIAFLVAWGELFMGIALILGLMTRYAAFAGAFMVANFWFAKGQPILSSQSHDVIWFVILIVLGGLHAGRTMGLDAKLSGKYRFLA